MKDTEAPGRQLRRSVGALDLTALGIGAIIGTGIFVIIGEGDRRRRARRSSCRSSWPRVTCVFSALSYAELASTIPVSGSAYTYAYATLGELVAWIIGWDLILEYGVSVAAVAVGWGGYLNDSSTRVRLSRCRTRSRSRRGTAARQPARRRASCWRSCSCWSRGVRESARVNIVMVTVKLAILAFFIVVGVHARSASTTSSRSRPTASTGWSTPPR